MINGNVKQNSAGEMTVAKPKEDEREGGSYFTSDDKDLDFVSSGCQMLDNIIGGGYVLGRVVNIVGDKSTGKTALACEAINNFLLQYPKGKAAFRDREHAFDERYAAEMGMPVEDVDFGDKENPIDTVEDFYRDLKIFIDDCNDDNIPGIYVLDSLDALSDEAERKRDIGEGTYGGDKPKQMGVLFRKLIGRVESSKVLVIIISQVREKIGISFGEKYTRSGGKALDFYASQIIWISHIGQIHRTIDKVKMTTGIQLKAKCKKNKIGFPFRECTFNFMLGYGVDDFQANFDWLKTVGRLDALDMDDSEKAIKAYLADLAKMDDENYRLEREFVAKKTREVWNEIETKFLPTRKKYA